MTNYTQFKDYSVSQKLMVFGLLVLICVSGFAATIKPFNIRGEALPATPPVTPPITPPIINKPPVIYTNYLYQATVGRSYTGFIRGMDPNPGDVLTMTIQNLPPGIYPVACQNYPAGNIRYITCRIEGTTVVPQRFNVVITLRDDKGGVTQKTLTLKVVR